MDPLSFHSDFFRIVSSPTASSITIDLTTVKHWFKSGYCKVGLDKIWVRIWGGAFKDPIT